MGDTPNGNGSTPETPTTPPQPESLTAIVLVRAEGFPGEQAIFDAFHQRDPELPAVEEVRHERNSIVFNLGAETVSLTFHSAKVEDESLQEAAQLAWYWPAAAETVDEHVSHVELTIMGERSYVLERHVLLTYLCAAVLDTCDGVAVFMPDAGLLQSAEDYTTQADGITPEGMPLMLWIHFGIFTDENDTLTLVTRGMHGFGMLDIEVRQFSHDPPEVLDQVFEVAHYLLINGPVLDNGSSIQFSNEEKATVNLVTSSRDEERPCMLLEFGSNGDAGAAD